MRPTLHLKWLVMLLLCLANIAGLRAQRSVSPGQDTRRKIVSDAFVKNRREIASPHRKRKTRVGTKRATYRLVAGCAVDPRPRAGVWEQLGIAIGRLPPPRTRDSGRAL